MTRPRVAVDRCVMDAPLPLTLIVHQVYRNARYDLRIDYRQPPPPPDLAPDDAAWLDAHLRAKGLRSQV